MDSLNLATCALRQSVQFEEKGTSFVVPYAPGALYSSAAVPARHCTSV
jgi:hypothetical protein